MRKLLAAIAVALVSACGSSTGAAVTGPATVAVGSSDVPSGMVRCAGSGSIDSFLSTIKTKDPSTYTQTSQEWQDAKSHGATSAQVVFYADSADHCTAIESSKSDMSATSYPVILNFVIQFKDEKTAQDGYTNQSIFNFSASSLSSTPLAGVVKGKDTGLSDNSVILSVPNITPSIYFAVWQKKAYMVILAALNMGLDPSKKLATTVNGRIS